MKQIAIIVAGTLLALVVSFVAAGGDTTMPGMQEMHGMHHGAGMADHERASFAFGHPGQANEVNRTIQVTALDTMQYTPSTITVRQGETIKFVITNAGKIRHEFVLGDSSAQREHAEEMKKMMSMAGMEGMTMHDDPNGVSLEPGQTKTLIWHFTRPGSFKFACHEPGHYEAGMIGKVAVEQ